METSINEIEVNGVEYVRKDSVKGSELSKELDGLPFVIIRTYSAGVHAGYLIEREGKEVTLKDSIRIWYWEGAASLSQLAVDGVSKPSECKFAIPLPRITLTEAIEVISVTEKARLSIQGVKTWKE